MTDGQSDTSQERWVAEQELRRREVALKERELDFKILDAGRSRWINPLTLGILAAVVAAIGSLAVAVITGRDGRILEQSHAESDRILEMIKTGDPDKAANNLKFLLDAGLISNPTLTAKIRVFLAKRGPGEGPALPAPPGSTRIGANFGSLVPGGFFSSNPDDFRVQRSIRTNNPANLNVSEWQKIRPGFVGVTSPDGVAHVITTIYRTPEHGIAAWYHLITVRFGFRDSLTLRDLAEHYAGAKGAVAQSYIDGWRKGLGADVQENTVIATGDSKSMMLLAKAIFSYEAGQDTPIHDDQIAFAIEHERQGTLPP